MCGQTMAGKVPGKLGKQYLQLRQQYYFRMRDIFLLNASAATQGLNARTSVACTKRAKPKEASILSEPLECLMPHGGQTSIEELEWLKST